MRAPVATAAPTTAAATAATRFALPLRPARWMLDFTLATAFFAAFVAVSTRCVIADLLVADVVRVRARDAGRAALREADFFALVAMRSLLWGYDPRLVTGGLPPSTCVVY